MENDSSLALIQTLLKRIEALEAENAALRLRVQQLEIELAAAKKNSRNSSKPPSSDIIKPQPR